MSSTSSREESSSSREDSNSSGEESNSSREESNSSGEESSSSGEESNSSGKAKILVLDGGTGTHLRALGARFSGSPLWSAHSVITYPDLVQRTHKEFFQAGADVAITVTYQLCSAACAKLGYPPSVATGFVQRAVELADKARHQTAKAKEKLVMLGCGSYGASLGNGAEYKGEFCASDEELRAYHRWRLGAALAGGSGRLVDGVVFETLPKVAEAKALLPLLREYPDLRGKVWIAFSCKSSTELCGGENFRECAGEILRLDAHDKYISGIGVNCCPIAVVHDLVCRPPLLHWLVSPTCPPSSSLKKTRDVIGEQLRVLCYPNNENVRNVREEQTLPPVLRFRSTSTAECQTHVADDSCRGDGTSGGTSSSDTGRRSSSSVAEGCKGEVQKEQIRLRRAKSSEGGTPSQEEQGKDMPQLWQSEIVCDACHRPGKWGRLAASALQWMHGGEHMAVGGCCGTAPHDVRQIAEAMRSFGSCCCL